MKKLIKWLAALLLIPVAIIVVFLGYVTITDYKPPAQIALPLNEPMLPAKTVITQGDTLTATTFNIGYAGLDEGQDFFMDGGTRSRSSSKSKTDENILSMGGYLQDKQSDFYLLQEVDIKSSRSYKVNEVTILRDLLPQYGYVFALNYKVPWVPVPVFKPMGSVQSGLLTMSQYASRAHTRYDLPGKESWPVQQMELDRAFIESRYPVDNGKEFVLVNLHLSAFDEGGVIRKQQLEFLEAYIEQEVKQGNYLLLVGDWNHSLPGTDPQVFPAEQAWPEWLQPFPVSFGAENFNWGVDPNTPTVRTLDIAYEDGVNFLAVIDGFLASSNIEIIETRGEQLHFKNSDHNPVTISFRLL